ncbi:MAG: hypothetical protein EOO16_17275 [Chitinophagaceae bacterium]|nr:MAG: hypothetical protein EOO16_17275 [Chitinophagaceae bacterium]
MKRLIWIAGILLCSAAGVDAQSSGAGSGSRNTAAVSATGNRGALHTTKKKKVVRNKKGQKKVVTQTVPLQEEKIYHWKNGQRATPTGNEATSVNGQGYTTRPKDSLRRDRR